MAIPIFSENATAPPQQVSDEIRFHDDFEAGMTKWVAFSGPAGYSFGTQPGYHETGNVRQSWFLGSGNVLTMNTHETPQGIGYGLSASFPQTGSYIVLFQFAIWNLPSGQDPYYPGDFTIYDDGFVRLRIEGRGTVGQFSGGRLVAYAGPTPWPTPDPPTFVQVLLFGVWYLIDVRVYTADGAYQLFVNEAVKGGFPVVSPTPRGHALLGDDSYAPGTFGVASWDNLVVGTLNTPAFSDNFDDGSISNWVREYSGGNVFDLSTQFTPPSAPNGLKAQDTLGGTAYGFSPYIDLFAPMVSQPDYRIRFNAYVPAGTSPSGVVLVSDGAAHVTVENRDANLVDLKAYVSSSDIRQVGTMAKGAWHAVMVVVFGGPQQYDVWVDSSLLGTGFPFVQDAKYRKAPSDLLLGDHTGAGTGGQVHWDDVLVQFGVNQAPTLTPCAGGGVTPGFGARKTQFFTYCVVYADADNDPPRDNAAFVLLDNTHPALRPFVKGEAKMQFSRFLSGIPNDYAGGAEYTYGRTWFYPSTQYTYKFHANDGLVRVETTTFFGPTVTGCDPPILTDGAVDPIRGLAGRTVFTWVVTLRDLDDTAYSGNPASPPYVAVVVDGTERILTAVDPSDTHTDDGKTWYRESTLAAGGHTFRFKAVDSCDTAETATVSLPQVSDLVQTPCNDDWVTFHHDAARTGVSECLAPAAYAEAWKAPADGYASLSSPAVADRGATDLLFIGREESLRSYTTGGTLQWSQPLPNPLAVSPDQSPTLAGGLVIMGANDGVVRAYTESGVLRWSHDANAYGTGCSQPAKVVGSVASAFGLVYVSTGDRGVFLALDLQTGALKWRFELPDCGVFTTSPTVAAGRTFVAAATQGEAKLYALPAFDPDGDGIITPDPNPALSELVWTFTLQAQFPEQKRIESTPAVYAGGVFFGAHDGKVRGLLMDEPSPTRDKILDESERLFEAFETWGVHGGSWTQADKVVSSPAVHDHFDGISWQKAIFTGARKSMLAIDRETGQLIWSYIITSSANAVLSSPAIASGRVYFGHETVMYALRERPSAPPGAEVAWTATVPGGGTIHRSSAAILDGHVFVGIVPAPPGGGYHVWAIKDP